MKKVLFPLSMLLILVNWQCTKTDEDRDLSVKESIEESSEKINIAADRIARSMGYKLLSVRDEVEKSIEEAKADDGFRDSIDLELIAGIYEFRPTPVVNPHFFFGYKFFEKTGTGENLVVKLPEQMVFHPKRLHMYNIIDSGLENNFEITASDYHFYFNWWNNYDYRLTAGFKLNSEEIGGMSITSIWKSRVTRKYENRYTFPEGYSIFRSGQTGDTTKMVFGLTQDKDTLLMEKMLFTGDGFNRREKQYTLSIGDVDIKKASGIDSIQVFQKGTLQKKAGAKIVDQSDYNVSLFHRRDILLSFDDGTQAKLSDLISPAMETLKNLSVSLDEMYISKHIVDYIAFNIYYINQ